MTGMARSYGRGRTRGTSPVRGLIGGATLRALRNSIGLTQEQLAERLTVSPESLQSWETGRWSLVHMRYTELQRIRRTLHLAGVAPHLLHVWDESLNADAIVEGFSVDDPELHPLALVVPNRLLSELLAWPLSGQSPRQLRDHEPRMHVPPGVQDELAANLRAVTDRAGHGERAAMLRRQAKFFVAEHTKSRAWIEDLTARELRSQPQLAEWSPEWTVARSHAVTKAMTGDPAPLQNFVRTGLVNDEVMEANLRYWAYWVGEIPSMWSADSAMLNEQQPWSGRVLLDSLIIGLEAAPYRELCAHSVWALLHRRASLAATPVVARRLTQAIATAREFQDGTLSEHARRRLDQVDYLIGSS